MGKQGDFYLILIGAGGRPHMGDVHGSSLECLIRKLVVNLHLQPEC